MNLIYGPSAIEFSKNFPDYYLVGVGPYIRIYRNDIFVKEHFIFPITTRIVGIRETNQFVITYASNLLKVLVFSPDFQTYEVVRSEEFEDYILAASINEEKTTGDDISLSVILHHGQICQLTDKISITQPKVWKIVTSAFIVNPSMFICGDSFGCITVIRTDTNQEINKETEYGTVFGIDYNFETEEILAAYEFRSCGLFKIKNNKIVTIWISQEHPSRVWGCKILPIGPISFGEDGSVHLFKYIPPSNDDQPLEIKSLVFNLHRTKNITAVASRGNEIITGGQNSLLRHLTIFDHLPDTIPYTLTGETTNAEKKDKKKKDPLTPFSLAILKNGEVIVGTLGGSIYSLPSRREMLVGEEYDGWYLMQSYENYVFGASRSHHHYLLQVKQTPDNGYQYRTKVLEFPGNCAAVSLAVSPVCLAVAYSDNNIKIYDFDGNEKMTFSITDYIKKPPIAICIHKTRPVICFGSHSSRVVVIAFNSDFTSQIGTYLIQSASSDGFRGIIFCGDFIYCAGRTDGTVSIIGECGGEWCLKSSWRIAAQCKATAGIDSVYNNNISHRERPIVSVVTKEGIALWDIETQTMVSQHLLVGPSEKLTIKFTNDRTYTLAWIDHLTVHVQPNVPSIPAYSIGTAFHGMRGLCMAKTVRNGSDLIATGGCDRDVKLWRIVNGQIRCVESLQAVDSGTHAVCFNEKYSLLFAGGSKEFLYVWRLADDDQLFRLNIFEVGDNNKVYKLRVTTMSLTVENRLFIGMSDATMRIYDYSVANNNLNSIEKVKLKGVPVSSNTVLFGNNEVISVSTSTGDAYWFYNEIETNKFTFYTQKLQNCGIHCIRSFVCNDDLFSVTAGDDGSVKIWRLLRKSGDDEAFSMTECLSLEKGHTGGTKALAIDLCDDGILRILSFSYDQKAVIYVVNLNDFAILNSKEILVSVTDGIACEFLKNGFVVFGFAIQYFNTDETIKE